MMLGLCFVHMYLTCFSAYYIYIQHIMHTHMHTHVSVCVYTTPHPDTVQWHARAVHTFPVITIILF